MNTVWMRLALGTLALFAVAVIGLAGCGPSQPAGSAAEGTPTAATGGASWSMDADCSSCHNADDLKAATADCTLLTDGEGTTVNPHGRP